MKPVVIIAIAVGCSIAGTLGVLIAWQSVATMQAQEVYDEYESQLLEAEIKEGLMQSVEYEHNREVCVDMFSNVMSMYGESNPYQDCLDYGYWFALERELNKCEIYDTMLVVQSCQSRLWTTFYDSMMPKAQALTQEQRDYLTYDKQTMDQFSVEWEAWSDLYLEIQLEIGEISRIQSAKDQVDREKIQEQCSIYYKIKQEFRELMDEYDALISSGQIDYKELDRLEAQAKRDTGYYYGMDNYILSNC